VEVEIDSDIETLMLDEMEVLAEVIVLICVDVLTEEQYPAIVAHVDPSGQPI
jgi:hypothetical protein